MQRRLPPMPDENQKQDDVQINRRNSLVVSYKQLRCSFGRGADYGCFPNLKIRQRSSLQTLPNLETLPDRKDKMIEGLVILLYPKGLTHFKKTTAEQVIMPIFSSNELVKAVNEIRDEFAMKNFVK